EVEFVIFSVSSTSSFSDEISLEETDEFESFDKVTWRRAVGCSTTENASLTLTVKTTVCVPTPSPERSEEHTSELQSRFDLVRHPQPLPSFPTRRSSDLRSRIRYIFCIIYLLFF